MLKYSVDSLKFAGFVGLSLWSLFRLRLFLSFVGGARAWICHSTVISDKGPWGLVHLWPSIGSILAKCCPALAQQVWCQLRGADKPSLSSSSGTPHRTRQICHRAPNTCSESSWWGHVWPQTQTNSLLMFYNSHNITRTKPIVNIYTFVVPTQIITRPAGKCHGFFTKWKGFCKRIIGWKLTLRTSKNLHSFSHSFIHLYV